MIHGICLTRLHTCFATAPSSPCGLFFDYVLPFLLEGYLDVCRRRLPPQTNKPISLSEEKVEQQKKGKMKKQCG